MVKTCAALNFIVLITATAAFANPPDHKSVESSSTTKKEWVPSPEHFLLKLQDPNAQVRARNVERAMKIEQHDYRVVELLSRLMDDTSNAPLVRLDAACIVAAQNTPYAMDGARRVLQLINETGYPAAKIERAQAALVRHGDDVVDEMSNLVSRGDLSNKFFKQVMEKIGTSNALVALDRNKSHQSQADRHRVKR
jgi:hypothetical protein